MLSKHLARALWLACAAVLTMGAAAAQTKVGIINLQRAIVDTAEIKKAQADLEAKYKPRTAELEGLQKELQDIQVKLAGGKVTPQEQQDLQMRGQRLQREYQRKGEDLQGDVDRERNDILQKANERMHNVVQKIAEEKGLDVVIDVTNTVYFKPALDITNEATKAYDAANPVK
jgi:outer membrane protein